MSNDLVMVMCPPYPEYDKAPENQSQSELRDCPKCKNKMWLSQKKKGDLMFYSCIGKDIILACYYCITKMTEE
jgi:ssDNA-binding Zn-finger/Zn-ribbon topoisomerase 1